MANTFLYSDSHVEMQSCDSLLQKLEEISDSISVVTRNTEPITHFSDYAKLSEGWAVYIAMLISIIAIIISYFCFRYQRESARLLRRANQRKPSLFPIVKKIYDNNILLHVIYEFDSDYNMSYTIEQKHSENKRSSNIKHFFYSLYPSEKLLYGMKLPEDIIMLEKYEIYENDDIYNIAFAIRDNITKYNECIERAIKHLQNKSSDEKIRNDKSDLINYSRKLTRMMFDLDYFIRKEECPRYRRKRNGSLVRQLEFDLTYYIVARFFAKMKNCTSDIMLADPYYSFDERDNIVDAPLPVNITAIREKKNRINSGKSPKEFDSDDTVERYIKNAVDCIDLLYWRTRKDGTTVVQEEKSSWRKCILLVFEPLVKRIKEAEKQNNHVSKCMWDYRNIIGKKIITFFGLELELLEEKKKSFNDTKLRKSIESFFLGLRTEQRTVYDNIVDQVDNNVLDTAKIIRYESMLQIFIQKHILLSETSNRVYNNENRRIERKKMYMSEKEKNARIYQ